MNILKKTSLNGKHISPFLLIPLLLLVIIGLVTLYSTLILPTGGLADTDIFTKQLIFIGVGSLLFLLFSYIDLSYLKHWQVLLIIYTITIILLVLTLLFGPVIKNVKRWLIIGGIQIQPSEIAKFTVIIVTSVIFSMKEKYSEWILFLLSFLFLAPILVLIYIQPSGSIMVLTLSIWFLLVFMGLNNPIRNAVILTILLSTVGAFLISSITGNNLWFLLLIVAVVVGIFGFYAESNWKLFIVISFVIALLVGALSSVTWRNLLKDYQKQRIVAFINPEETSSDNLFNVNQSKIAIGSGRIFGKGFGNGTQSKRNFLPEFRTDFIFASYAEEFGLVGSLFLMLLYGLIIAFCFMTAVNCTGNTMYSLISMGVGIKMLLEIFINIGTNTGSIPATGIPLPLMSAGGTITVMTLVCLGLVHNISLKNSQKLRTKKADIIDVYED
jgi:rod shape determining protein RodA